MLLNNWNWTAEMWYFYVGKYCAPSSFEMSQSLPMYLVSNLESCLSSAEIPGITMPVSMENEWVKFLFNDMAKFMNIRHYKMKKKHKLPNSL